LAAIKKRKEITTIFGFLSINFEDYVRRLRAMSKVMYSNVRIGNIKMKVVNLVFVIYLNIKLNRTDTIDVYLINY
jgi:hypothetical protein